MTKGGRVRFEGFGGGLIEFYDGLEDVMAGPLELRQDLASPKTYWEANVATYQADVRAPMTALITELEAEFGPAFGAGKVFRPYRDVRFAKDKTPYKTHCGAVIEPGRGAGAYYVEVGPGGLRVGGGCFRLAPDQLARFRRAVGTDAHGRALEKIVAGLRDSGWDVGGDQLRTRPRGIAADHPRLELLRHRTLRAVRGWEPDDTLYRRACLDRVRTCWRELKSLNEWALDHVGVSEMPTR